MGSGLTLTCTTLYLETSSISPLERTRLNSSTSSDSNRGQRTATPILTTIVTRNKINNFSTFLYLVQFFVKRHQMSEFKTTLFSFSVRSKGQPFAAAW